MCDDPESSEDTPAETDDPSEQPAEEPAANDKPAKKEEGKEHVTFVGGRRRGRRQVSKKKTIKDDEGYLGMFGYTCIAVSPI